MTTATQVRERPIIFSAPMVRAILAGRKTQTRREVKFRSAFAFPHIAYKCVWEHPGGGWVFSDTSEKPRGWEPQKSRGMQCPYGKPGDRLWVREAWKANQSIHLSHNGLGVRYRAEIEPPTKEREWRPSIHMPRWASRITLEITNVRVERLEDITPADALAEGVDTDPSHYTARIDGEPAEMGFISPVYAFSCLWNSINGADAWGKNPWVWVVEFKRVEA